ncbi:MAG: hypothetical protein RL318_1711 [Fibrobacterota bacterium]|jgi:hypothetical protein
MGVGGQVRSKGRFRISIPMPFWMYHASNDLQKACLQGLVFIA